MTLTPAELEALPTLTIHMDGGVEVNVRPEAYLDALGKNNAYAPRYVQRDVGLELNRLPHPSVHRGW